MVAAIDAHVGVARPGLADALELLVLQEAQQLGLQRRRDLADLVEEQRAALGRLDAARLVAHRAGERAARVAEQLAREQLLGQRRAVDHDERLARRACCARGRAREHALAGAVLAAQQDRRVRGRGAARELERRAHLRRLGREVDPGQLVRELRLEIGDAALRSRRRAATCSTTWRICAGVNGFGR